MVRRLHRNTQEPLAGGGCSGQPRLASIGEGPFGGVLRRERATGVERNAGRRGGLGTAAGLAGRPALEASLGSRGTPLARAWGAKLQRVQGSALAAGGRENRHLRPTLSPLSPGHLIRPAATFSPSDAEKGIEGEKAGPGAWITRAGAGVGSGR
jgi:hypothetical protein